VFVAKVCGFGMGTTGAVLSVTRLGLPWMGRVTGGGVGVGLTDATSFELEMRPEPGDREAHQPTPRPTPTTAIINMQTLTNFDIFFLSVQTNAAFTGNILSIACVQNNPFIPAI